MAAPHSGIVLSSYYDGDDDGESLPVEAEAEEDGEDTEISLYYAQRVSKPVNLSTFSVQQLQQLLLAILGEKYRATIKATVDKKALVDSIEASMLSGEERFHMAPRQTLANEVPFEEISPFLKESNVIGGGGFGKVYRGELRETPCAIKTFKGLSPGMSQLADLSDQLAGIRVEAEAMKFANPYICTLLGVSQREDTYFICMELMAGSLDEYLRNNPKMDPWKRLDIIEQIRRALLWLHKQKPAIIHLDLKFENILYDRNGTMKLSDFGLSAILPSNKKFIRADRTIGNLGHMAPEIMALRRFNQQADVYGFAVLMWEIMRGMEWNDIVQNQLTALGVLLPPRVTRARFISQFKEKVIKGMRPPMDMDNLVIEVQDGQLKYFAVWPSAFCYAITKRWNSDPAVRPALETIDIPLLKSEFVRKSLEYILRGDEKAQKYWMENQPKSTVTKESSLSPIPWDFFTRTFFAFFHCDKLLEDLSFMRHFARVFGNLPHQAENKPVTIEMYSNVVTAFGPLSNFQGFAERLKATSAVRWFHPELSRADADSYVDQQADGMYIVRYSQAVGAPFAITVVHGRTIVQIRVKKQNQFLSVDCPELESIAFTSIRELVTDERVKKTLNLLTYQPIMDVNFDEDSLLDQGYRMVQQF